LKSGIFFKKTYLFSKHLYMMSIILN